MAGHHSNSTGLKLVSIAERGGGRFHITDDSVKTLCKRDIPSWANALDDDWALAMLRNGVSTSICAKCRMKRKTVIDHEA